MFQRFIARQAILRDDLTLLGYDLRFRSDDGDDGATRGSSSAYLIVSSSMVFHWESLTGNGLAFISLGLQKLLSGAALILPRSKTVVEIPSTVPCNAAVVLACQSLKTADYHLALSEWRGQEELRPLAAVVDYLRVNLPSLKESDLALTLAGLQEKKTALIADGIHSWDEHREARKLGIRYFQGDFLMKPAFSKTRRRRDTAQFDASSEGDSRRPSGSGAD